MHLTKCTSGIVAILFSVILLLLPATLAITNHVSAQGDDDTILDDSTTDDSSGTDDDTTAAGSPASPGAGGGTPPGSGGTPPSGGGTPPGFQGIINPIQPSSLTEFLLMIVDIILIIAIPIIILFIIYAGFLFVTAQGNESKLETAKSALLWSVIGGVVVLGARVLLEIIEGTVDAFRV